MDGKAIAADLPLARAAVRPWTRRCFHL